MLAANLAGKSILISPTTSQVYQSVVWSASLKLYCCNCAAALCESTGPVCVSDCRGTTNGVYQWCGRCDYYLACSGNTNYFYQCAGGTVWNDDIRRCDFAPSPTCTQCVAAPSSTTSMFHCRVFILNATSMLKTR